MFWVKMSLNLVFGGNSEIIRILDQNGCYKKLIGNQYNNLSYHFYRNEFNDPLYCAIISHQ